MELILLLVSFFTPQHTTQTQPKATTVTVTPNRVASCGHCTGGGPGSNY